MDPKSSQFCALDVPTIGIPDNAFVRAHGQNVRRDAECANAANSRRNFSRTIKSKTVPRAAELAQATVSAKPEAVRDAPSEAVWINEQGQILDCSNLIEGTFGYWKDELKGRHISVLLPDLTHVPFMQYPSPSTLWLDHQGKILDCSGPIEEMFGYWKHEMKGQHISLLLPDLTHIELLDDNSDNSPRLAAQDRDAIVFGNSRPEGDDNACSVLLKLISTKAGRELAVLLRSRVH
jgi:PAS domain S-box-containing protein